MESPDISLKTSQDSASRKYNILYVDDEESNLRIFKTAFKREYNIYLASSGDEAIRLLHENHIHLIITDQKMPEMTGTELLEKVLPDYPDTIRIILTGFADIEAIVQAVNKCGIYKYITKPWDRAEMKVTLEKAFETYQERFERTHELDSLKRKINEQAMALETVHHFLQMIQKVHQTSEDDLSGTFKEAMLLAYPEHNIESNIVWASKNLQDANTSDSIQIFAFGGYSAPKISGSFINVLVGSLLNKLVYQEHIYAPEQLLYNISEYIYQQAVPSSLTAISTLKPVSLGIIAVNVTKKTLQFAGADSHLYYFLGSDQLLELPGETFKLGQESKKDDIKAFRQSQIELNGQPITFYLKAQTHYNLPEFEEHVPEWTQTLPSLYNKPLSEQKGTLLNEFVQLVKASDSLQLGVAGFRL